MTFDIMISYSHADKQVCTQIYEELTRKGFRVWIDFDQMHGNVMNTMAYAIERSKTIIIGMSESYRRSSYCRTEADYAFQRRLKIVPILLQNHYKPDGWLLFLIGQLYYVDFTKYDFPQAFDALMKEIKVPFTYDTTDRNVEVSQESDVVIVSSPIQLSTFLPSALPDNMLDWSQAQVSQWLFDHNLIHMARLLSDYDGRNLDSRNTAHGPEEHHKLIVDSTSIAVPQPEDSQQRKTYFHSKSATNYAFKIQTACDFNHRIVHVSECHLGSVHDITILRESGLLEHVNDSVQIIADKAYIGEEYVITPKKKPQRGKLTSEEKSFNYDINSARAAIENINQRIKTYAIIGSIYRETIDDFDKIIKISQVVSAVCNLNLIKHPMRK
ncbi:unnamed protein product [Rotaria sp. Silwood2]|nr:unnamed protein product [Rotaria sp. Silwood2]CAF3967837.1 unnamed protein product [Rotaria sp. Silwood2]